MKHKRVKSSVKRNKLIVELRDFGFTYQSIADLFGLSQQRIDQIYKEWKI